ncbi:MAG TPA: RIP metalloprotease RseP, partial [Gemmatimonadales bacterium]|nr:RIP metalloprotease RseP [Gemmatimonadales bacterium]
GFGRPILSWRRGETEYWISWIPFGGYVKMAGLEDEGVAGQLEGGRSAQPIDPARAFDRRPVWARLLVVCAGVTMNVVLAFVLYAVLAGTVGTPELETTTIDSVEAAHLPAGARALASLAAGDRILRINDETVRTWSDVMRSIVTGPSELRFGIAGRDAPVVVRFGGGGLAERQAVAEALVPEEQVTVQRLEAGRPAARAGLEPGDVVLAVDGVPVRSVDRFLERIWTSAGRPLAFDVRRGGARLTLTIVPDTATGADPQRPKRPLRYGHIGASMQAGVVRVKQPAGAALVSGWRETTQTAWLVLGFLKGLVLGQVSVRDIGGPILVAQASGQAARLGFDWLLRFMALFSVNLAILNLLPIPILDGGQVVFLLAEAVRGKPLPLELRNRLTQIGFFLLLAIMIFATSNDVWRWLGRAVKR